MPTSPATLGNPVRISFSCADIKRTRHILGHLAEERLVAGGTIIQAETMNWIGGELEKTIQKNAVVYTTMDKLPLIRDRLEMLYGDNAPTLSQFVMQDEKKSVVGWIDRNTRK